jgi:hypothetical protein
MNFFRVSTISKPKATDTRAKCPPLRVSPPTRSRSPYQRRDDLRFHMPAPAYPCHLSSKSVRDRPQDLWIKSGVPCKLLRIHLIALAIAVRDGPQLADVRHDHLMTNLLKLFADPDRMRTRFHGHPCRRHVNEPLLYRLRGARKRPRSTTSPSWFSVQ